MMCLNRTKKTETIKQVNNCTTRFPSFEGSSLETKLVNQLMSEEIKANCLSELIAKQNKNEFNSKNFGNKPFSVFSYLRTKNKSVNTNVCAFKTYINMPINHIDHKESVNLERKKLEYLLNELIYNDRAVFCRGENYDQKRFLLKSFNTEFDLILGKTDTTNIHYLLSEVESLFSVHNNVGVHFQIGITLDYKNLKIKELSLHYEELLAKMKHGND